MKRIAAADQYVIARESNVVRVDFARTPDPPTPQFPGAGALRNYIRSGGETDGYQGDRATMPQQFGLKATVYTSVHGCERVKRVSGATITSTKKI